MNTKSILLALLAAFLFSINCSGDSEQEMSSEQTPPEPIKLSPEKVVEALLENAVKKNDYMVAFELMANKDKAEIRRLPWFYDFVVGKSKDLSDFDECWQLYIRHLLLEMGKIIEYEIMDHYVENDIKIVPVMFSSPDHAAFGNISEEMRKHTNHFNDEICESDLSLQQKLDSARIYIDIQTSLLKALPMKERQISLYVINEGNDLRVSMLANPEFDKFYKELRVTISGIW
jgi:hypothetical protein